MTSEIHEHPHRICSPIHADRSRFLLMGTGQMAQVAHKTGCCRSRLEDELFSDTKCARDQQRGLYSNAVSA